MGSGRIPAGHPLGGGGGGEYNGSIRDNRGRRRTERERERAAKKYINSRIDRGTLTG